ncbi:MAG: MBL fold metallo-hydrolase [Pseudomonadota bacterium]|nr:MBL fold metallo-hydrolase [Pseudomonadota bacterium]
MRLLLPLLFAWPASAGIVRAPPASPPASPPAPVVAPEPPPTMRLHFIDVGQGAATLVELPCGAMLVDTGGEDSEYGTFHSNEALRAYLDAFFVRRADLARTLDVLVLTHPHIDHVRGALPVLQGYTVRALVENGQVPIQEDAAEAMTAVRAHATEHPELRTLTVTLDDLPVDGTGLVSPVLDPFPTCKGVDPSVVALWGHVPLDPGWGEDDNHNAPFDNENNHSVVTRVDFGLSSLLVTGDLEEVAIRDLVRDRAAGALDVDVYVVGHHGSHNGTTRELLQAMSPEWAVLEVGPADRKEAWTAWQYGHPRQPTIELLEQEVSGKRDPVTEPIGTTVRRFTPRLIGEAIYATGWDGTIVLEADAEGRITRGTPDGAAPLASTVPDPPPQPPAAPPPPAETSPAPKSP